MANTPRGRGGAFTRRHLGAALAIALLAAGIVALRVPGGGGQDTRMAAAGPQSAHGPQSAPGQSTGTPLAAPGLRLGIVAVKTRHVRRGGLRPGDAFDAIVTVRNHGRRAATVTVDVTRGPREVLPFRPKAQRIPAGAARHFILHMTAAAKYIRGREFRRTVRLALPERHGAATFVDATPKDNRRALRAPVGLYVDLEVTAVRPGPFAIDLRGGRYRAGRQAYEVTITNRGTATYERGARFDLSLYAERGSRRLTRWSREIDRAIAPGERITIAGQFAKVWQNPPWLKERRDGLFEGKPLTEFPMRLIAILRMPISLDPARRNNERDTRFLIGMEPTRREKQRLIFDPLRIRSGRLGLTDR